MALLQALGARALALLLAGAWCSLVGVALFAGGSSQSAKRATGPSARTRSLLAGGGGDSCVGKCGSWSDSCWCDEECASHGNCCPDYAKACGASGGCPKCGGYTCDEWIQWDPAKYTCSKLRRDWGCDCAGCGHCTGPTPAPVDNAAALKLFDEATFPDAKCLDGTMAGYYLRHGEANKFLIFFQGGGWCYDQACEAPTRAGTLKDCRERSSGSYGSSSKWPNTEDYYLTGMLNADPRENPTFHNWTLIYVPYCDGASFSGDAVVDGLYFKGTPILTALLQELTSQTGIRSARQVVISGGSAGASTVYYHVDSIAKNLALHSGEVVGLPDAGFFLNLRDKNGVDCWPSQMRSLFDVVGYGSLHQGCLSRFPEEQWKCLFPEYYADLISTRVLALNSLYDSSETSCTLRLDCSPSHGSGRYPKCDAQEMKLFDALRDEHMKAWLPLAQKNGSGVWAPACIAHTMTWGKWVDSTWEVPAGSGNTMAAVVQRWLADDDADGQRFVYQDMVAWPQNKPCASYSTETRNPVTASGLGEQTA